VENTRELDVSPWEGLLRAVRISAWKVVQAEAQLAEAERANDGELEPSPAVAYWRRESRNERQLLARDSKAAIDAGVAEQQVRAAQLEAATMVGVFERTLGALGLDPVLADRARLILSREILAVEAPVRPDGG
jgi:hypothetical protein